MASPLRYDDFALVSVNCELRYRPAFLQFDRTGQILRDLRHSFSEIEVSAAGPQQTSFNSKEGNFVIDLQSCRFTNLPPDRKIESSARQFKVFSESVCKHLEIDVFTRVGVRIISRKRFDSLKSAKTALALLELPNLSPKRRFNSSESPIEVMFRWEDEQIGATIDLKSEKTEMKINAPQQLREGLPKVDSTTFGLTLDMDYYTVAPVEREQWEAHEWIATKARMMRKEADEILRGAGR